MVILVSCLFLLFFREMSDFYCCYCFMKCKWLAKYVWRHLVYSKTLIESFQKSCLKTTFLTISSYTYTFVVVVADWATPSNAQMLHQSLYSGIPHAVLGNQLVCWGWNQSRLVACKARTILAVLSLQPLTTYLIFTVSYFYISYLLFSCKIFSWDGEYRGMTHSSCSQP